MTNSQKESLNKYLTEEVFGEKWITAEIFLFNTDFTTPDGWWKLMDHAIAQDDFDDFLYQSGFFKLKEQGLHNYILVHTNWLRDKTVFPKAYAKFKGWKGE